MAEISSDPQSYYNGMAVDAPSLLPDEAMLSNFMTSLKLEIDKHNAYNKADIKYPKQLQDYLDNINNTDRYQ